MSEFNLKLLFPGLFNKDILEIQNNNEFKINLIYFLTRNQNIDILYLFPDDLLEHFNFKILKYILIKDHTLLKNIETDDNFIKNIYKILLNNSNIINRIPKNILDYLNKKYNEIKINTNCIMICNVKNNLTLDEIDKFLKKYKLVRSLDYNNIIVYNKKQNKQKDYIFITFDSIDDANKALIKLNNIIWFDKKLSVNPAKYNKKKVI